MLWLELGDARKADRPIAWVNGAVTALNATFSQSCETPVDLTGSTINVEGSLGMVQVDLPQWTLLLMASNGKQLATGTHVTGTPNEGRRPRRASRQP